MTVSQRIGLIALFVLAVAGMIYGVLNFRKALPEVEVPIRYDKNTAEAMMDSILADFGYDGKDYRTVTVMDERGKFFIDREFGADTIPSIHLDEHIPIWRWKKRYFVPLQKDEFTLCIRPDDGAIARFHHEIAESISGADMPADSVRYIAEIFLEKQGYVIDNLELKTVKSEKRPNRRDHWFTYELRDWELGNARHWITVAIWGDEIGIFDDHLHIPERWWREFQKTRSSNSMFQSVDTLLAFIFAIMMLGYLVLTFRRGGLAWKFGAIFAVFVFFAGVAMSINSLPLSIIGYDTADSFSGFVIRQIFSAIMNGALMGMIAFVAGVAGERIYREFMPKFSYLPQLCSVSGWRTREFGNAVLAGYLFAMIHIGFVVLFYVLGKSAGFWSPTQSNYTDLMSTYLPWLFPLSIAIIAAVTEDFAFRLFGVSYLSKLFKSTVVGVIIPAFIWGFLHSSYPQEPGFVRGIEVGLIGIGAGWLMIRYGIIATLTWHFAVDSGLIGLYVFRSGDPVNIILTALCVLLPALLIGAGFVFGKKRKIAINEDMIPGEHISTPVQETVLSPAEYVPVPMRKKLIFGVVAIAGLSAMFLAPDYPSQKISIKRTDAAEKSSSFLARRGIAVDSFQTATYISTGPSESELRYVYQQSGWMGIRRFYGAGKWEPLYYWKTRFLIPEQKNEYRIGISSRGELYVFTHFLEEGDSGNTIVQDSAFILAKSLLRELDMSFVLDWELIEKSSTERPKRVDHTFMWQSLDSIGQAHRRLGIHVLGDEASIQKRFLKHPEEWERRDMKTTPLTVAAKALPIMLQAALILLVIMLFGKNVVRKELNFRVFIKIAAIVLLFQIVASANAITTFLRDYNTAVPMQTFYIANASIILVGIIFSAIAAAVSFGAFWGTRFRRKLYEKIPFLETLIISAITVLFIGGVMAMLRWLEISLNIPLRNPAIKSWDMLDTFFPLLSIPAKLTKALFVTVPVLFIAYRFLRKKIRSNGKFIAAIAFIAIIMALGAGRSFSEIVWAICKNLIILAAGWVAIKTLLKDNLPIYIAVVCFAVPMQAAFGWFTLAGNDFYLWNAIAAAVIGIILWLMTAFIFRKRTEQSQS